MVQPANDLDDFTLLPRLDLIKSTYTVMEWNINGWNSTKNNFLMDFKKNIIHFVHADFIVLPETHCFPNQIIEIENYTLFQNNRKIISNCVRGSGGIAIAVRNDILNDHVIISVFNDKVDGQIGLKLKNSKNDLFVGIVGLYLPPDNYVYGRDAEGFFNSAASLWEDFSDCDLLIGAGDVNSRTKDILDYLPDIDGGLVTQDRIQIKLKMRTEIVL